MANITLRFTGDTDSYGDNATIADMVAMNELMAGCLESMGHTVEIGPNTGTDTTDHSWDQFEADSDDELRQLTNAAWDHACNTYEPAND